MTTASTPSATSTAPTPAGTCRSCGKQVRGHFCSHCGASAAAVRCLACDAELAAGDRFCFECGARAGGESAPARGDRTGWIVAGIAFVGLVGMTGIQWAKERRERDALPPQSAMTAGAAAQSGAPAGGNMPSAADIAAMTPRQQLDRLYDRVMRLREEGKKDSIAFFAPMVLGLYEQLSPLDADLRYDLGTVANANGQHDVEMAQADTILRESPTHLLGLVMAARASEATGDQAGAQRFRARLVGAEAAERTKRLPEYERHQFDIDQALGKARSAR